MASTSTLQHQNTAILGTYTPSSVQVIHNHIESETPGVPSRPPRPPIDADIRLSEIFCEKKSNVNHLGAMP